MNVSLSWTRPLKMYALVTAVPISPEKGPVFSSSTSGVGEGVAAAWPALHSRGVASATAAIIAASVINLIVFILPFLGGLFLPALVGFICLGRPLAGLCSGRLEKSCAP